MQHFYGKNMLILHSLYQCIPGISWLPHHVKFGEEKVKLFDQIMDWLLWHGFLCRSTRKKLFAKCFRKDHFSILNFCWMQSERKNLGNTSQNVLGKTISQCSTSFWLNAILVWEQNSWKRFIKPFFEKSVCLSIMLFNFILVGPCLRFEFLQNRTTLFLLPNTARRVTLVSHEFL